MRCFKRVSILMAFAVFGSVLGDAMAADGPPDLIRSLEIKSRTDSFLQNFDRGQTWIIQAVSYEFTPQVRIYEMGAADPSGRGVARGELMASSLEGETGRRETSECEAFQESDRQGNTIHGAEIQMVPLHDGPYIVEVTGYPTLAGASTKIHDYRLVVRLERATSRDVPLPATGSNPSPPSDWHLPQDLPEPLQFDRVPFNTQPKHSTPPANQNQAQSPPGPDTAKRPTAAEMLLEAEWLMRSLGLTP